MSQNEARCIVALATQAAQILVQPLRQIELAADGMMDGLPVRNLKKLRRGTQFFPQLLRASIGIACFWRSDTFDGDQHCAQGAANFELLPLMLGSTGEEGQLLQPLLEWRGRFGRGGARDRRVGLRNHDRADQPD